MENKYYLDEQGVIELVSSIASKIKAKTSNEIVVTSEEDPNTGEIVKTVTSPNNFATVNSVVEYLKNRSKIKINQQSTSVTQNGYDVEDNISEYNGEDEVQINLKLVESDEIANLFSGQLFMDEDNS